MNENGLSKEGSSVIPSLTLDSKSAVPLIKEGPL